MTLLLVFQGVFIGANFYLLDQAEHESRKQGVTKQIIDRASRLLSQMYEAGDKVGKYAFFKDEPKGPVFLKNYTDARDGIRESLAWLKTEVKAQPNQSALLGKINKNVEVGLGILESMKAAADTESRLDAVKFGMKQRIALQPCIEELVHDHMAFMSEERALETNAPQLQAEKLQQQSGILVGGAVLNVLIVLLMWIFINGIVKRLDILTDNSQRLKDGESLHPPMNGRDEIDILDNSFHKMVATMQGEEALLRSSENSVLSMISQMPAGLLIIDGRGRIEFANPKIADALGFDQDDLTSVPLANLFSTRGTIDGDLFDWLVERSDGHVVELTAKRKDEGTIPVEFSIADVSYEGKQHFLAMALDVSERHEMEKLRQAFVAMVSHELRTPLSSVSMFLELLEMGVFGSSNEKIAGDLKYAGSQTDEVIMLINDLLDLEKLEANKLELVKSDCEIEDVIDKAVEAMANTIDAADVLLHFEGAEERALVDPERITQALTKMLSSVIRLTPQGETITIDTTTTAQSAIEIRLNVPTLRIPDEQVETIFERFQQISLPALREGTGLGLGLALSRAIIQQHGGSVGLLSEETTGTTFWINIPNAA
ncbi:MAG: histidine kinase dimerization/phospho-acceptor domain-containing protein [Candidatus Melainabacteria bacterium]|nr:histidine kinase dimerization/phospho-acceptor domain-containing protein [Candidatus Melainabacteria bacterium]